jgi:hypothetical protein
MDILDPDLIVMAALIAGFGAYIMFERWRER